MKGVSHMSKCISVDHVKCTLLSLLNTDIINKWLFSACSYLTAILN